MWKRTKQARWRLVLVMVLMTCVVTAQQSRRVDFDALKAAPSNGDNWLTYGRDYAETHYSPLRQIDRNNVNRLGLAWAWDAAADGGTPQATPIVFNGTIYGVLPWNVLFAVDARTGKAKWRWDPQITRQHILEICCGPSNRGVALYNGKVYAGLLDGRLVALDQDTGKLLWQVQTTENLDMTLTAAVRVVKGKVIVGSSGAEQAVRGHFGAYDAETGKRLWRFYTVPGDPSKPFEHPELEMAAKTWTGEWWKMGGGGTVWDGMAYDPNADILYVGTGNGGPWNRNYRSPQGGDNLFLASIIAIKPDSGKMVWHFQETPGDTWDFTSTQPIILADLPIDGRTRKVLMHAPKNGFFYVLDRITGEFISGEKFAQRVTWATGLDKKTGRPIEAKGARFTDAPVLLSPAFVGAHNWQPMSFNPLTGLVYIPGQEFAAVYEPDPNFKFTPGYWNTGVVVGRRPPGPEGQVPSAGQPAVAPKEPEGAESQPKASGKFLVAWDPIAQKERWRNVVQPAAGDPLPFGSGTMTTAGRLVFQGPVAYDGDTGKQLWRAELGGPAGTPVTFVLDGKQYVSMFGQTSTGSRLYTFVVDGKQPMPATVSPSFSTATAPAAGDGKALTERVCSACHTLEVITGTRQTRETWKRTVDDMVARGASGTAPEHDLIVDYLAKAFGIEQ